MMSCRDLRELAPELALGALSGAERADALAHVASCLDCRRTVESFAETADALLTLAPDAEPPAGFESRVLARVAAPRRSRARWMLLAAACAALLIGGTWFAASSVFRADRATRAAERLLGGSELRAAVFHAPNASSDSGKLVAYEGRPSWIFLWIKPNRDTRSREYRITFRYTDGSTRTLDETMTMDGSGGSWGGIVSGHVTALREVSLADESGATEFVAMLGG